MRTPSWSVVMPRWRAGNTLIWEHDATVLRLEGDFPLAQAIELAESAQFLP